MKKTLVVVLTFLILVLVIIKIIFMVMPEVVVSNFSDTNIKVVTIELPNNRIVFESILKSESSTIYYDITQADGTYKYTVIFENDKMIKGECGYISNNEIGKIFKIAITNTEEVRCGD